MKKSENYLERKPILKNSISYVCDENDIVTLEIQNNGIMNRIAQKLFSKPKVSYIHLDEYGSFAIICADGEKDIISIGETVEAKFAEKAHPLYERLSKFFQIMDSYGFIEWK